MTSKFDEMVKAFTSAAERGDGAGLAALFTENGVYHDGFYGAFRGRAAIADMLENRFHRDAKALVWEMADPVRVGDHGYAHYRFSYTSKLSGCEGRRVVFEGMSHFRFENGEIASYEEIFDQGIGMSQLGFDPTHIAKRLHRQAENLREDAAGSKHLKR